MLSSRARYAARAMLYLCMHRGTDPVLIQEIAEAQEIPLKYLQQILASLKASGFLSSRKGPGGGYLLSVQPEAVTLGQVVRAMDGPLAPSFTHAPSTDGAGEATEPAALHDLYEDITQRVVTVLDSTTFAQLIQRQQQAEHLASGVVDYAI